MPASERTTARTEGFIYVRVDEVGGVVKIGWSADPAGRNRQHDTSAPTFKWVACVPGTRDDEKALFRHFREWKMENTREYFHCKGAVAEWVQTLAQMPWTSPEHPDLWHRSRGQYPWEDVPWEIQDDEHGICGQPTLFHLVEQPRAARIADVSITQGHAHLSQSDDWWTPAHIIDDARKVLGVIDLDPASNPKANETVQADHIYTIHNSGLNKRWWGRVWLNPPYGGRPAENFGRHLIRYFTKGDVTEAIVCLSSEVLTTIWFNTVLQPHMGAVAISHGRINFTHGMPEVTSNSAPNHGTMLVYLGPNVDLFIEVFSRSGWHLYRPTA